MTSTSISRRLAIAFLTSTALIPATALAQSAPAVSAAPVLPNGGTVVAGGATIAQPQAGVMHITQSTDRAIINWQGFSIGEGGRVDIAQLNARAALLNRVTGTATSEIAGQITANGRVFLVNPNGIVITKTGSVNAAGFTASTLDIADRDFMAGSDELTVIGQRQGAIGTVEGGYAGLMGGKTADGTLIRARLSHGEASGTSLDLSGDGFLKVALPAAGISVAGTITAGDVVLRAGTAREAARQTVNLTGTIRATGIDAKGGTVTLTGDTVTLAGATIDASGTAGGGTIRVGGDYQGGGTLAQAARLTVDAATAIRADATSAGDGGTIVLWSDDATAFAGTISARGASGGRGGDAEVSGKALLTYTGTADLRGAGGFGTLLLDPSNLTISSAASSGLSGLTANAAESVLNVDTLTTGLATANMTVTASGNITVAAPVAWSSSSLLTLTAGNEMAINAPITVNGGGQVALNYATSNTITGGLTYGNGASLTFADGQSGQALTINNLAYTLVRSMADLDGINNGLSGRYALANDIDASGRTYDKPIFGKDYSSAFRGTFDGLGHVLSNLNMTSTTGLTGLIGATTPISITQNIGIIGATIRGGSGAGGLTASNEGVIRNSYTSGSISGIYQDVGGLVGKNLGKVYNSSSSASVSGPKYIGGLIGSSQGEVINSFSSGTVEPSSRNAGGLIGVNVNGTIGNVYATGSVKGTESGGLVGFFNGGSLSDAYATGPVNGSTVGGLIGLSSNGTINRVYATGAVSGTTTGGLIGLNYNGSTTVSNAYWNAQTSGRSTSGGGSSLNTGALQGGSASGLGSAFGGGTNGLYPYLKSLFPNGVQAVSGFAYSDAMTTPIASGASGAKYVHASVEGGSFSSIATGANGYFYMALPAGTLSANGTNILLTTTADSTPTGTINNVALAKVTGTTGGIALTGTDFRFSTSQAVYSAAVADRATALAGLTAGQQTALNAMSGALVANNANGFTLDTALNLSSGLSIETTAGDLTVAAPVSMAGTGTLTLKSSKSLLVNAPIEITGGGQVVLGYDVNGAFDGGLAFAAGSSLTFADGQSGQALTINGAAYTLVRSMDDIDFIDGAAARGGTGNVTAANLTGKFALAKNLDASAYSYFDSLVGQNATRTSFGTSSGFNGIFTGLGHTIDKLSITRTDESTARIGATALFGLIQQNGLIRDLGLTNVSISGNKNYVGSLVGWNYGGKVIRTYATGQVVQSDASKYYTGGLVGYSSDGASILQSYSLATVKGNEYTGGLLGAGNTQTSVMQSFALGDVSGTNGVGGLVGGNLQAQINQAYAMGSVTLRSSSSVNGTANAGGLVGENYSGNISQVYSTGRVVDDGGPYGIFGRGVLGGLIGEQTGSGSAVANVAFDRDTSGLTAGYGAGTSSSLPINGSTTTSLQSDGVASFGFDTTFWGGGTNGQYPYLKSFFPNGVQAISGIAVDRSTGQVAPGARVATYGVNAPTVSTGANGYFYTVVPNGTLGVAGRAIALTVTLPGATTASGLFYSDNGKTDTDGNLSGLSAASKTWEIRTALPSWSAVDAALGATLGSALYSDISAQGTNVLYVQATGSGGFTLDRALIAANLSQANVSSYVSLSSDNDLTLAAGSGITADSINLSAVGSFTNNAGSRALQASQGWLVGSAAPGTTVLGGLTPDYIQYDYWNQFMPRQGNGVLYALAPTVQASLKGSVSKVYDGTTAASLTSANYDVTGAAAGDVVTLGTAVATFDTANAGTGKTVTVSGFGSATALNGQTPIYGYRVVVNGGSTLSGAITPATLTYVADAASRTYGDANPVLTGNVTGFVNGETQSGATSGTLAFTTAAGAADAVGQYAVTGSGLTASNGNYVFAQDSGNATALTVTQRALTVTATALSRVYGDANPTLAYTVGGRGLAGSDTLSGALATSATTTSNVGSYGITQGALSASSNYALSYTGANLTVTARPITVVADVISRSYGTANPTLTYTVGGRGLVGSDTLTGGLATSATATSNVGNYSIGRGTLAAGSNYAMTITGATLKVTARPITVTADALSRVYGNPNPVLTYTIGGQGLVGSDTLSGALATSATTTSNVGTYAIGQGSLSANSNYALTYAGADLSVTPRPVTVTANALSRVYGDANPTLTYTIGGGLLSSDTLTGALATSATTTSAVGSYDITPGTLSGGSNYTLAFTGANLSVTTRPITVTADALSRVYGNANPALTYTVGGRGLVGSDTLSGALATSATTTSDVGSYGIAIGTLGNDNYAVSFTGANLAVTARPITVTADTLSRVYGDANPALTYTVGGQGLAGTDTLSGALTTAATATSTIGSYDVGQGTLAASSNYALTFAGATLAVTARPITVTADALSRTYGDANPALTYMIGGLGLVGSDTLSGALATGATVTSNVGSYAIGQGTLAASSNYALTFAAADLTVTAQLITVTADALSRTYGDANPALTYTIGGRGLVGSDALSGGLATNATAASNVGNYAIGQGTLAASGNYAVTFNGADLSVTARPITVTADALSRTYGDANPALTYTVGGRGLAGSDTLSGALATSATTTSNVGNYAIGQGSLSAGSNYVVSYLGANLAITARPITVTADTLSRVYGDANPALTYAIGGRGLVGGDTLSGGLSTDAKVTSNVGSYAIGRGTLVASPNYTVTFVGGTLTVIPRLLQIVVDPASRAVGQPNPTFTYRVGGLGLVNGDTLSGALDTPATSASEPGTYAIEQGSLAASNNYTVRYTPGALTLTVPAIQTASQQQPQDMFLQIGRPGADLAQLSVSASTVGATFSEQPEDSKDSSACGKGETCRR